MKLGRILIFQLVLLLLLVVATGGLAPKAHAFDINNPDGSNSNSVCGSGGSGSAYCNSTNAKNTIYGTNGIIITIANIIAAVTGVAAVIMIIIGGFRYVLSGGDSNGVNGAKNMIIYAIIGLVVVAVADGIVRFVISRLS